MKKIHFEFFDEEKVYYDTDLNYTKEDEYIVFTLDNVIYKVKLDDNFEFRRITEDCTSMLFVLPKLP